MTDLDRLIEAVEAGAATDDHFAAVWSPNDLRAWQVNQVAMVAYNGSLDAALRLHEALLPGWVVENLGNAVIDGTGGWNVRIVSPDYLETYLHATANAGTPARAWLLAILRALKAKGAA